MKLIFQSANIFSRLTKLNSVPHTCLRFSSTSAHNSLDNNIKILRSANAVCFDVDSTVIMDEGIKISIQLINAVMNYEY